MKLFVVSLVIAVVAAESLENSYLPPSSRSSSGGNRDLLNPPNVENPNSLYGPPEPSTKYLPGARNVQKASEENSQNPDGKAATLRFDNENNSDGSYKFEFETENKIKQQETGEVKNVGTDQEVTAVQGSYSYLGADGIEYTVTYTADENGFQASEDHLPTPPPIPEEIQKSLAKKSAEEAQQGYPQSEQNGYRDSESVATYQESTKQPPQVPGRQYLAPNKSGFKAKSGYQY